MAARPGSRGKETYSFPLNETRAPFNTSNANIPWRCYDNESDNQVFGRNRDAYTSQSSQGLQDGKRYYDNSGPYDPYNQPDTDSDVDAYAGRFTPSSESFGPSRTGMPESPAPEYVYGSGARESYPAWTAGRQIPLSKEEIEDIFLDLTQKFGFQRDSMRNMFDFLMQLLDSRASRMTPDEALISLHADYIGGEHANYRKWYFAAQLDLDDAVGQVQNPGIQRLTSIRRQGPRTTKAKSLQEATERWCQAMNSMSQYDRVRQIALYLLCWGEAAQVRFVPECLCFIFKCADDYYRSVECQSREEAMPEGFYLRSVIKPLYRFIRDQVYEIVDGKFMRREKDHENIIGYDDVNQLFWYPEGIARIKLNDGIRLVDLPPTHRFMQFGQIDWSRAFLKTYYERRSFGHLLVNFSRILVIHISMFWFYTAYNSPFIYTINDQHSTAMTWSATALGGAAATFIMILVTLTEFSYIPTSWNNTSHLSRRLIFLVITLGLTAGPTIYIYLAEKAQNSSRSLPLILGIAQFFISIIATLLFAIVPSARMFGDRVAGKSRKYLASQTFTASYPSLHIEARVGSIAIWLLVFGCKFTESYFFLILSFRRPITTMVGMKIQDCNDKLFGDSLCRNQAAFTLTIMFIMDLILFFLDTFLWYVFWNAVFSIGRSLALSIWTPMKDIYARLPNRVYEKILFTSKVEGKFSRKVLVSQIWNALIISMYRDHLLSINHVQKLLYHLAVEDGRRTLKAPQFFAARHAYNDQFFPPGGEAERRVSFFAQSLTATVPKPLAVASMPIFTVLTPHYNEKILLSLREIIREGDNNSRVTLLEYLKKLHPVEWQNFVQDTKVLTEANPFGGDDERQSKANDLPFYAIGFKSAAPEYTLRTRIWASLRAQTLYRTVSGMMNYASAIKLLYRVEDPEVDKAFSGDASKMEQELERMARLKFKFVVSMQRYSKFNKEEHENVEFLLRAYPDLQIAYLEEEPARKEGADPRLFSALIDGHSEFIAETGRRRPKFRIELPGHPILGDGKSDNQNHAIIFYRGEYLQLIDANQDNYLEECLKIRNILGEFEEYSLTDHKERITKSPVAIVGAREYIFSENIGILGDLAAGKEQTFGTLAARSSAWIGGKLHYGHPDFLNAVFMNTRGGVSKAQKGLHLNEDIYAGMTAFGRGGRIKHAEYYQCGKGRDLGFGTILNFQTKIGTGMGEQMLSREYYYMGTQLPIDRFLTFYYGHPGFHINNMLIMLSIQIFIIAMVFLGTLHAQLLICDHDRFGQNIYVPGCYDLPDTFDWIRSRIISIVIVILISFLPLFLQDLLERGAKRAIVRLGKQFISLSPFFEVFSTQIYTHSILSNLTFGGARYIATGRGFATTRIPFSILFSRFAGPSIYLGMRTLIMLLYVTMTLWTPYLIYFWITVAALCIAPFVFNPHQFDFADFIIDYREFLRWMSRGNSRSHANSWIGYCRLSRTMITGYKREKLGRPSDKLAGDVPRAGWRAVIVSEVIFPIVIALVFIVAYMFVKSFPDKHQQQPPSSLIRIAVVSVAPIAWNAAILLVLFIVSLSIGPILESRLPLFGSTMAATAHIFAVVGMVGSFELLWFLEFWEASHAVLGLITVIAIQRAVHKVLIGVFLSREFKHDETNRAWWTGRWYGRGFGASAMSQSAREFLVKIIELSLWSSDFLIGHFLLIVMTPLILIPYIDRIHSTLLFWLRPSKQIRSPLYSTKHRKRRRWIIAKYGIIFATMICLFVALLALPVLFYADPNMNISCGALCDDL